jgi:hypothetical protein
MEKRGYYIVLGIVILTGLASISGCDKPMNHEAGFLEGVISIGPICPVETVPPGPGCLPTAETYKAYPVEIWTSDGRKKVAQINPSLDGSFSVELASGNYLVMLQGQNRISSSNLPEEVTITAQDKTIIDIDIDTGIR